ncbi:MAG: class I SAM-dependent RNA methyltransferase [Pseudomonadota bacterium]
MEIYAVAAPGLAEYLAAEARETGFTVVDTTVGGVTLRGGWPEVWRANLVLRGANRILVRVASFRALHLAQLDKRARKLPWSTWLRSDKSVRVEATCRKSRIYHDRAAAQRIARAISDTLGARVDESASVSIKLRIEDDLATISIDTSGQSLHKRGYKQAVNKAPMRETLAAMFLRACAFDGAMPVVDPMCGSGTFVVEAAEIAAGLAPGRARRFAFENLATFDRVAWEAIRAPSGAGIALPRFFGSDRDQGAVTNAVQNAERAGVASSCDFTCRPVRKISAPTDAPGLVIVNPPYGARIGNKRPLFALYAAFGERMRQAFHGWRVGLITSEPGLAKATGLPFKSPGPFVDHGGQKIRLWQAGL